MSYSEAKFTKQDARSWAIAAELNSIYSEERQVSAVLVVVVALALLLLAGLVVMVVTGSIFLHEDGSIQFFNRLGWGFCFVGFWGCG